MGPDEQKDAREEIKALIKKHKEEDEERQKAFEEQIKALLRKQRDEDEERKKSLRDEIAARMGMAREEHVKKYGLNRIPNGLGPSPDQIDPEVRKGFLKMHILGVLMQGPSHGYEIMHSMGHLPGHLWRPSPGSLYPALESLEAKGFISCQGDGRRKVYALTPKGEDVIDQVRKKRQEQFLEMKAFMSDIFGD